MDEPREYGALNAHGDEFHAGQKPVVKNVIITVEGDINEVADQLRRAGMQVNDVLAEIGIITGAIDTALIDDYRALEGVQGIFADSDIHTMGD